MAKDKSEADLSAKKEKKDKKRKSSEAFDTPAAINEQPAATKKEKKSKKERKPAEDVEEIVPDTAKAEDGEENKKAEAVKLDIPLAALVPFANPLCDEKAQKKVLKGVKKGKSRTFHHQSLSSPTRTNNSHSRQTQGSETRRERMRENNPQIPYVLSHRPAPRCRCPRCRH